MDKLAKNLDSQQRPARNLPAMGSCDDDSFIRLTISDVISRSSKSREQIAEEMSVLTGRTITVPMMNAWTAESRHQHRFPIAALRAFCIATGDNRLAEGLMARLGFIVIDEGEKKVFEIGQKMSEIKRLQAEVEELRDDVVASKRSRS